MLKKPHKGKHGQLNDLPGYRSKNDLCHKVYDLWLGCVRRAKSDEWKKRNPWYKDTTITEDVMILSKFVNWIEKQSNYDDFKKTYNVKSWSIDKDSIKTDNNCYDFKYMTLMTRSENSNERLNRSGNANPPKKIKATSVKDPKVIMYFESAREAGRANFNRKYISECCNGKRDSHKGYYWEYIDGE